MYIDTFDSSLQFYFRYFILSKSQTAAVEWLFLLTFLPFLSPAPRCWVFRPPSNPLVNTYLSTRTCCYLYDLNLPQNVPVNTSFCLPMLFCMHPPGRYSASLELCSSILARSIQRKRQALEAARTVHEETSNVSLPVTTFFLKPNAFLVDSMMGGKMFPRHRTLAVRHRNDNTPPHT